MKINFIFTKRGTNIISFIVAILIFLLINYTYAGFGTKNDKDQENKKNDEISKINQIEEIDTEINQDVEKQNYSWWVEIPAINLIAPIENGTDPDTLKKAVGHFEESSFTQGNIGLAAHNRRIR